ncbi:PREDICTED: BSD domain-containing protein 1-like [Amphimedon queenslandica]|nr:PREDICTED: BSD domain-containing protein 1-like [Amphimedon queenslandica]|eukprot:XP_011404601.1 PREDICTED: BSD domain-containing protein 1-like [Amphimedon queenslandica]
MAESDTWWSSWVTSAKEKSLSALNATKRDLSEFMSTVQRDTSNAVVGVADSVKSYLQQEESVSSGDSTSSSTSVPQTQKSNEEDQMILTEATDSGTYDRSQALIETIRNDPLSYQSPPDGQDDDYEKWKKGFDVSNIQEEISKLLVTSSSVRRLHSELVPSKVSYESFWSHYFYRIHLIEEVDERRAQLVARVHSSQGQLILWDDDEDDDHEDKKDPLKLREELKIMDRAMADSSESFVCISEEGSEGQNKELAERESPPLTVEVAGGSDSDWEKWDD